MKRGNLLGLPVNWMLFSIVTVIVTSGTTSVFGQAIMDPIEVVGRIDNATAIALGSMTFIVAAIGVNIVANFVSAAFDLANASPSRITFRTGGLIAGVIVLFTVPWHFYGSPEAINFFVGTIGGVLGPLYGIMVADYYLVKRQSVDRDHLYSDAVHGKYYYTRGWNMTAVYSLIPSAILSMILSLVPIFDFIGPFNWFISAAVGATLYAIFSLRTQVSSTTSHQPISQVSD